MDKLRLIQCGVGGHGEGWVKNTSSRSAEFDLVALVDVAENNLRRAGEATGIGTDRQFGTLEAALDKVEADAVLTVTPPPVHVEHARLAFGRGLHLMTEKPIAATLDQAREMIALAREAGKQLVISQNYRFNPPLQKLKSLVEDEAVGKIGHGHLDFYIPADFTGTFREKMDFPLLVDMAIHHVDMIRAVLGRDITRVVAWSFGTGSPWYQHEAGLKMLLELEGNLPFSYSGDWSALGRPTSWSGNWRLQGAGGSLHFENDAIQIARCEPWMKNPTLEPVAAPSLALSGPAATLHRFAAAIATGVPAEISGANNFNSFAAVMAGVQSAKENRAVDVPKLEA